MHLCLIFACVASITASLAEADEKLGGLTAPKAIIRKNSSFPPDKRTLLDAVIVREKEDQISLCKKAKAVAARPRGGSCDSDAVLFSKVAVGVALEAAALLGILAAGRSLSAVPAISKIPDIGGLHVAQWTSFVLVIFASSLVGAFVDGGLSAATNQVLDPNVVPGDPDWYASLRRPSWEPPGWVFPIMWLIVSKPTQLAAVSRLFQIVDGESTPHWKALAVYCTHLALGDTWNKVFFGFQCPGRGAAVITTFFAVLLASASLFWSIDETAGKLMLPTCAWVLVATALNWSIYLKN